MPQELAVYEDFTIKETLWYFGRLYRVPNKIIKERIEFLLTFLDLPRSKRLVLNMSGGQKRRVSLASALVHSPPLLILDEPTVGVDPLLRQSIWQHLVTLTQTEKITVIVTTHYIEEARRANIVGLMRRGKLLAENAPEDLMAKHDSSSLEDVFLKLCVSDTMRRAQKFASLTGMPVQGAIMGTNSIIPTPEIGSKRHHQMAAITAAAAATDGSSQSPDEGLNSSTGGNETLTNSGASSNDSDSNLSASGKDEPLATGGVGGDGQVNDPTGGLGRQAIEDATGHQRPSSFDSEATTIEAGGSALTHRLGTGSGGASAEKHRQQLAIEASEARDNTPKPPRRFFKNLFKFGASGSSGSGSSEDQKALERRRQSGSYFIEQLMSKYQGQDAQLADLAATGGRPINQMLSCDVTGNKQPSTGGQQAEMIKDSNRLNVPKISIHGGNNNFGDSGNSSNGSSQNHSPVGVNNQQQQQQVVATATTGGYQNHSYQASECGSTYNDLALISGSVDHIGKQQMNSCSVNMHNNNHTNHHHQDLDDDVMLDPELFMNPADLSTMSPGGKYDYKKLSVREYCDTVGTITWKNYIRLKRNVPLLLFQFALPAIQVILFCICVGNDPFDIPVAVVNEESSADSIAALSSQFLRSVDHRLVKQVNYSNLDKAIESVKLGQNWGVIHIPENFTISIHKRFAGIEGEVDDSTLENSTIKVYPDMTNQPIGHAMEVAFRKAYSDLSRQTFEFLGLNAALSDPPIRMESAIYGKVGMNNYLQYMSPGVLISISYIMATGLTSLAFIIERRDGLYDRTLAAGVDHVQMLISHSIVQLVVMVVQISLVVFFTFVIYQVPTNGPFVWVFLLLLLQGLAGMSFGLMVSAICKEENTAIMMILGTFYPNLLLAGVIWPIEAIPYWLRWFSYLQPQTLPTQALRDLIVRGWDIDQTGVWTGFAVTTVWLIVFLAISCIAFKIKK